MSFTLGADPEIFLQSSSESVSALDLIPGTKKRPFPLDKGSMHPDNVTLEFQVAPAKRRKEFIDNISYLIQQVKAHITQYDLEISICPQMEFSKEALSHPDAQTFGCSPDENFYRGVSSETYYISETDYRTAGGHIHIGTDLPQAWGLIPFLDISLGLLDYIVLEGNLRKKTYGRLGTFRNTNYGIEYRTPSNWWLKSRITMGLVYSAVEEAFRLFGNSDDGIIPVDFSEYPPSPSQALSIIRDNTSSEYFNLVQGVFKC